MSDVDRILSSMTMGTASRNGEGKEAQALNLAVLVYRDPSSTQQEVWLARSVFTGDVAGGRTRDDAIERLKLGIEAAIRSAMARGIDPKAWVQRQKADEYRWVSIFLDSGRAPRSVDLDVPLDGPRLRAKVQVAEVIP